MCSSRRFAFVFCWMMRFASGCVSVCLSACVCVFVCVDAMIERDRARVNDLSRRDR